MMLLAFLAAIAPVEHCVELPDEGPTVCPLRLPRITSIVIDKNGQQAWLEPNFPPPCNKFVLTERQVRRYFQRAWKTDQGSVHYTLPESPCYASGRITFSTGKTAEWSIDGYAVGRVFFGKDDTMFLYCDQCRFSPFHL